MSFLLIIRFGLNTGKMVLFYSSIGLEPLLFYLHLIVLFYLLMKVKMEMKNNPKYSEDKNENTWQG